jgi:rSAM/selenodomain-associated transferase 2
MTPARVSVVIPAINEEAMIGRAIESARRAGAGEIIVVDGGSQDQTWDVALQSGANKLVRSLPGRGIQLNSGAWMVNPSQEWIVFLHADNLLDENCLQQICDQPAAVWGAFQQRIDAAGWIYRWIEGGNSLRVRLRGVPFGDQAVFVRRTKLHQGGGFDEIPLMEDVAFAKRMRRMARPILLPGPVTVSSRRWSRRGPVRQTLLNWWIQVAYALGVSPQRLRQWYR